MRASGMSGSPDTMVVKPSSDWRGVFVGGGDAVGTHQEDVAAAGAGERQAGELLLADVLDEVLVVVDEGHQSFLG